MVTTFFDETSILKEACARSYEPKLKNRSNEWKHPGSPRRKKVLSTHGAVNVMFIVAFDGIILHHAVPLKVRFRLCSECTRWKHSGAASVTAMTGENGMR